MTWTFAGVIGAHEMDEAGIKAEYLTRLRRAAGGRALPTVTAEFSLPGTGIRADLAILSDRFVGVEIKSAADTLKRLPSQMEGYARYFDHTVLIVAPKHIRGLAEVNVRGAEVWRREVLTEWQLHAAGDERTIDGHWLQHLLPADAERRMTSFVDAARTSNPNLDPDQVRRRAFEAEFKRRYQATSDTFWEQVKGRKINRDDVRHLSRYHRDRQSARALEEQRKQRWLGWSQAMQATT